MSTSTSILLKMSYSYPWLSQDMHTTTIKKLSKQWQKLFVCLLGESHELVKSNLHPNNNGLSITGQIQTNRTQARPCGYFIYLCFAECRLTGSFCPFPIVFWPSLLLTLLYSQASAKELLNISDNSFLMQRIDQEWFALLPHMCVRWYIPSCSHYIQEWVDWSSVSLMPQPPRQHCQQPWGKMGSRQHTHSESFFMK